MPKKIVFFNHYHRGDLLTSREFIRQIKNELPTFEFEYLHFNHPKLTRDLDIPKVGDPSSLDHKTPFYQEEDTLYINTWIGCFWDIFCEHGGINMHSLYATWGKILETLNAYFETDITLRQEKESYLPRIDYDRYNISSVANYLATSEATGRVLICNGPPKSGQSFTDNMQDFINPIAEKNPGVDFVCTTKFNTTHPNVLFTDDLIKDTEVEDKRAPWEDRDVNNCDLFEISFLSQYCDAVVGKNSGPFVFCETYDNYMDPKLKFLSFNVSWGPAFQTGQTRPTETMSNGLDIKCKFDIVAIGDINNLTEDDKQRITSSLENLVNNLEDDNATA